MSASSGRALQVEVCLASERDALHLHGIWTVECVSVIVVKDDPAVFQGSYFGETWMSFRGDWILLSRQWGHPDGVWSIIRVEFRINTFQSYGHRPYKFSLVHLHLTGDKKEKPNLMNLR